MISTVLLVLFMDDILSNISKQWNKHHVVYMSNALLPQGILEKEFTIHFISASPHISPVELMQGIKNTIEWVYFWFVHSATYGILQEKWLILELWDSMSSTRRRQCSYPAVIISGNNPIQVEECSHGGLKCNYFCHTCKVGDTTSTVEKRDTAMFSRYIIHFFLKPNKPNFVSPVSYTHLMIHALVLNNRLNYQSSLVKWTKSTSL